MSKRLPRQIPPTRIAHEYGNALERLLGHVFAAYKPVLAELPSLMASAIRHDARMDAGEGKRVRDLIAAAAEHARQAVHQGSIEDLARKFAAQTATHQRIQLGRQVKAALGVEPLIHDRKLRTDSEQFIHENVALIKRIPESLHADVEVMVQRAVSSARPSPKLAEHIQARFGVSKRHARLIARDQLSKFHAKVNHRRQRELGVNKFIWRSVEDERVRETHQEFDGNTYHYDNPPENEDGESVLPGDDVQCRCSADPIFD